jgi:hypothetical protein
LSSSSDELTSNDSDRWIYALASLSRAAFELSFPKIPFG